MLSQPLSRLKQAEKGKVRKSKHLDDAALWCLWLFYAHLRSECKTGAPDAHPRAGTSKAEASPEQENVTHSAPSRRSGEAREQEQSQMHHSQHMPNAGPAAAASQPEDPPHGPAEPQQQPIAFGVPSNGTLGMAANDSPDEIDTFLFGAAGRRAAMNQSVRFLVGHSSLPVFGLCMPDLQADPGVQLSVEIIWQPLHTCPHGHLSTTVQLRFIRYL